MNNLVYYKNIEVLYIDRKFESFFEIFNLPYVWQTPRPCPPNTQLIKGYSVPLTCLKIMRQNNSKDENATLFSIMVSILTS